MNPQPKHTDMAAAAFEIVLLVIVIAVLGVVYLLDKHFEAKVTEQQKVEYRQHRLAEPKFTEK